MEYIDYICKLNNHDDYLKMLDILESKCLYVEYVLVDGRKSDELVDKFHTDIISKDKTREWWGTVTTPACIRYKIKASKGLFDYLRSFETFVKYIMKVGYPDRCINAEFGINDIAFFDSEEDPMLFTTTHEGYIDVRKDIDKEYKKVIN